jgi:hypothetical protein
MKRKMFSSGSVACGAVLIALFGAVVVSESAPLESGTLGLLLVAMMGGWRSGKFFE